ncbi:hypothetical protein HB662_01490 [Roseomonas frigidaquae]|uniref:ArsR family transcriptional regulator n=1 Tax=Falsiroseomonas frigidaquae TaxID=487318 RepID=A0ABX1EWC1_9PROT|nr:hypothetical protein [Falsiroseomonas frigidaquae]NKE43432.1 hypothetical protein [Falsiroseomonas frigidaquae]
MLLLLLAEAAAQRSKTCDLPFRDVPRLARLVAAPEAEVAQHLALLREKNLVGFRQDGTLRILALRSAGGLRRLVRVSLNPHAHGPALVGSRSEGRR